MFSIDKINLYNFSDLKKSELPLVHTVLLFLVYKSQGSVSVSLRYSEVHWLHINTVKKALEILEQKKIITIEQRPSISSPMLIKFSDTEEIKLNITSEINVQPTEWLTKSELCSFLECKKLREHFILKHCNQWIDLVNTKKINKFKLLLLCKICSKFQNADAEIKTKTVMKYINKPFLAKELKNLYMTLPSHLQQEIHLKLSKLLGDQNSIQSLIKKFINQ